jgi:hypothetical protein
LTVVHIPRRLCRHAHMTLSDRGVFTMMKSDSRYIQIQEVGASRG